MKEIHIICEKNIESRQKKVIEHLSTNWKLVSVVYSGNGFVEYIFER